jgi:hypothetical protein
MLGEYSFATLLRNPKLVWLFLIFASQGLWRVSPQA